MADHPTPGPSASIRAGWDDYVQRVLPPGVGPVQLQETRRAFYAGAVHLFHTLITMLDPDAEPTEADLAKMDAIQAEILRYGADLGAGRA